jgi:hypothetical protein
MCSPKRISKKYESSGYNGKKLFVRTLTATPEEIRNTRTKLKWFESRFLDSICAEESTTAAAKNDFGRQSVLPNLSTAATLLARDDVARNQSNRLDSPRSLGINQSNTLDSPRSLGIHLPEEPNQVQQNLDLFAYLGTRGVTNTTMPTLPTTGCAAVARFPQRLSHERLIYDHREQSFPSTLASASQRYSRSPFASGLSMVSQAHSRMPAALWNMDTLNLRPAVASTELPLRAAVATMPNSAPFDAVGRAQMFRGSPQIPKPTAPSINDVFWLSSNRQELLRRATPDAVWPGYDIGSRTAAYGMASGLNLNRLSSYTPMSQPEAYGVASNLGAKRSRESNEDEPKKNWKRGKLGP